jgi:hypothetical protein
MQLGYVERLFEVEETIFVYKTHKSTMYLVAL